MPQAVFIYLLPLEMMALGLKGPFIALIDAAIYSWGSFYAPASSMATICPHHRFRSAVLSKGRVRSGVSFWSCLWFPHRRPFLFPTHPVPESHGWLIMEQSCCPLICACASHVLLEALLQLWWIIWDGVTGAHGHSAPWLCQCQCWIHRLPRESWERDFVQAFPPSPQKPAEIKPAWVALSKIVCS